MSLLYYSHNLFARSLTHSCASTLTTYVLEYSVRGLYMCLDLRSSCLSICPNLTLNISKFTAKLLEMLLRDSCLKDALRAMLLKDIHDNSTKQQYLPYFTNTLIILSSCSSIFAFIWIALSQVKSSWWSFTFTSKFYLVNFQVLRSSPSTRNQNIKIALQDPRFKSNSSRWSFAFS